jgi:hypothetical protein
MCGMDPLSLVSTIEELIERKSRCSGLENREYGHRRSAALSDIFPQKLALTSSTCGGRSVGIVRSWTRPRVSVNTVLLAIYEARHSWN